MADEAVWGEGCCVWKRVRIDAGGGVGGGGVGGGGVGGGGVGDMLVAEQMLEAPRHEAMQQWRCGRMLQARCLWRSRLIVI